MSMNLVLASTLGDFCTSTANVLQVIGYIVTIFKIFIPLVIVILGILDLGQAAVKQKSQEELTKAAKNVLFRALAGILIFFIPNIVMWIFGLASDYSNNSNKFETCKSCVLHPNSNECSTAASNANGYTGSDQ